MTLDTFFKKFDQFADAPNAVAKMRELILLLAMQGRLSEKCPDDVSVQDLLTTLDKESGIKQRSEEAILLPEQNTRWQIPKRWKWVRFGRIAQHNAGKTLYNGRNSGHSRDYITTSNVYWGSFRIGELRQMLIRDDELERCTARKGDLLICEGGEAGRAAVWPFEKEIAFQNHVHRARFFGGIDPYFVYRFFETINATGEINRYRKGVGISNMSGKALASIVLPLPPLAEQKRIVAKVDELMALCDRLEAQQQQRDEQSTALARASLARFAEAPTPANLNLLFHKSYSIATAELRQSVLTLAIQGKLVTKDSKEESVTKSFPELVSVAVASNDRITPAHWISVPLGKLGEWRGGGTPSKSNPDFWEGQIPWVSPKDMKVLRISDAQDHISKDAVEGSSVRMIPKGSILMVVRGMILARAFPVAATTREVTINQDMKALLPFDARAEDYLLLALRALEPQVLATIERSTHGTCKLETKPLHALTIPIPPLAEQRRIVAKVDQLMALVDQLETQLAASRATAKNLLEAVVGELTTSPKP